MKTYIRRREKNDQLVVLYGGWGSDENLFMPFFNDSFDFILFYNYSADDPLVLPETKTYRKITVIGWSLGVWAAGYLLPRTGIHPHTTIAVNGTPLPVDDKYGIPHNVFEGTLNNLTEENMEKFFLRVFGDKKTYSENSDKIPHRSLKSLHDELRWLYNRMMEPAEPSFKWDYAVTSASDRVFPAENMNSYWSQHRLTRHIIVDLPHYFFPHWKSYTDFIRYVERHKRIVSPETNNTL